MTPQNMLTLHDPDNGQYGDCFRACIASLMDMPAESVPHVLENYGAEEDADFIGRMNDWLRPHGFLFLEFPTACDEDNLSRVSRGYFYDLHYVLLGTSPRGCNHNAIYKAGDLVHDPHPDGGGIIGPAEDGFYWLGFLARLT